MTTNTSGRDGAMNETRIDALIRRLRKFAPAQGQWTTLAQSACSDAADAIELLRAAKPAAPMGWAPIETAPRDGSNILIRFGSDDASQAKYVSGVPLPWKFIDTNDGITWLVNHAVDTEYGPTHWMPMPDAAFPAAPAQLAEPGRANRPDLAVWYGSMPESNGKSNWTAILHKGDIASGMTIDRSEYPDRVRYVADRVRWLIGELDEEPWILDYDADKHSGYTPPAELAQPQPPLSSSKPASALFTPEQTATLLVALGHFESSGSVKCAASIRSILNMHRGGE